MSMRSALALTARILQQFKHDPRTIVMFIVGPVLVLWLFSVLLGGGSYEPRLAGVDLPQEVVAVLQEQDDASFEALDAVTASERLANQEIDAIISLSNGILTVEVEGTDTSRTSAVMNVVNASIRKVTANQREELSQELQERMEEMGTLLSLASGNMVGSADVEELSFEPLVSDVEVDYLHGSSDWNFFDFFGPVFIGIFIFIFVFITSGMSLIT